MDVAQVQEVSASRRGGAGNEEGGHVRCCMQAVAGKIPGAFLLKPGGGGAAGGLWALFASRLLAVLPVSVSERVSERLSE